MISLDQILLLQEKVENAVAKIAQLNAENAALRRKCAELTNALAAETEQFSSFQDNQSKIEEGILSALKKLDAVENKVLESDLKSDENQENVVSSAPVESADAENVKTAEAQDSSPEHLENTAKNTTNVLASENVVPQNQNIQQEAEQSQNSEPGLEVNHNSQESESVDGSSQNTENSQKPQEDSSSQPLFDIF